MQTCMGYISFMKCDRQLPKYQKTASTVLNFRNYSMQKGFGTIYSTLFCKYFYPTVH